MLSHMSPYIILDLLLGRLLAWLKDYCCKDLLTIVCIGNTDYLYILDLGMCIKEVFDLLGVDISISLG